MELLKLFIKNFGIILGTLICFNKIIDSKYKKINVMDNIVIMIITIVSVVNDWYFPFFTYITILFLIYGYTIVKLKNNQWGNIIIVTLSLCISIVIFEISVLISNVLLFFVNLKYFHIYGPILVFTVQLLLINIPLLYKRMHRGLSFLDKQVFVIPSLLIAFIVIFSASVINDNKYNTNWIFLYFGIYILVFIVIINWRNTITRSYIERITIRDIDTLNIELLKAQSRIDELSADNERMGHILHKDKKLVSAMENDVETFMKEFLNFMNDDCVVERLSDEQRRKISDFKERGSEILADLREMTKDREGMITDQERSAIKLPKANNSSVDRLFNYMQKKAHDENISFQLTIGKNLNDINELFEKTISNEDFCTLLADLIDNAIIASKYNQGKQIMVNISRVSDDTANVFDKMKYNPRDIAVHIFDSGIPFTKEVLMKYGLESITTHADDEGSGLGLMKTYEILNKCGASLFIHEFSADNGLYTKEITVVFNRKHQYLIYTGRSDDEIAYIRKRADVTVVKR